MDPAYTSLHPPDLLHTSKDVQCAGCQVELQGGLHCCALVMPTLSTHLALSSARSQALLLVDCSSDSALI